MTFCSWRRKKMTQTNKKRRRRRTKGKSRLYFTEVHEKAIIAYASSESLREKTKLYKEWIQPAYDEMVDKIVFTFKFTNLPNIDDLRNECKVWLVTILGKYDPNKGSKAFSYFSVITKNWFIQKVKKHAKRRKREVEFEDYYSLENDEDHAIYNPYYEKREKLEFIIYLKQNIKSWNEECVKENEKKVLNAIEILFSKSDVIEIFNKKAIYLYLREITGLNTKQVVSNLNRIRARYRDFKKDWENS